ncbi:MAG: efflux RND transporter periplasmic adaptor subunit [Magnetococcales bacterium]|nr:efflux RND transporter periplasmic adaptor subunit [Magnetococcales bacterium]MBF0149541.1 efflux RND transporter periplasmic adaptor subunit [Magnetococcales bacterium]MBF0348329.1 efflux RND transporter periplasmic adaptor subunit [Magnetococcales bacterium]
MNRLKRHYMGLWLLSVLSFVPCVHAAPPPPQGEKAVLSVTVVGLVREQWPKTLLAAGGIHPWQEAVVAAQIGGLAIESLPVDVGSEVREGDELVRLSDATVKAAIALQRANVARARAGLGLAKANGDRARAVKGSGALSEQQITQYLLAEESAQAELAAAQASLALEEVRLRQTRILAADAGIISSRSASLGAVVGVGSELFRLVRQGRLEWRAELTSVQLALIKPGQQARLTLSNGRNISATLRQVAPTLDANTRKGLVYFDLPGDPLLQGGMFAQGEIHLGEESVLTLPQSAIVFGDGFSYVFERVGQDRVTRRKVTTGRRQGDRIAIEGGLEEKVMVVATGGAFLKDGDRVLVMGEKR